MKVNVRLFAYGTLLVLGLSGFGLWQRARSETSLAVTSVSPTQDGRVRVQYRLESDASDFTLIALPDTQYYSQLYPDIYAAQTQWIVDNKDRLNIVFVSHLGDVVQNNDLFEAEWEVADAAMRTLDGVVPYGVEPGNHDMQVGGAADFYEKYFPASRFEGQGWWGGSFDRNRYNYQFFSGGGDDYLILHMQYCPTAAAIRWANDVLAQFPDRKAIVTTHGYLNFNGQHLMNCQDKSNGDVTGLQMWNRLVKRNLNVFLVLAGHIPGIARRTDNEGRPVYQLLSDYQGFRMGGSGYLRIMTFEPSSDTIHVTSYSPYLDEYLTDPDNQFDLPFDMTGGAAAEGNVLVYSGLSYCIGTVAHGSCVLDAASDPVRAVYLGDLRHKGSRSPAPSIPSPGRSD